MLLLVTCIIFRNLYHICVRTIFNKRILFCFGRFPDIWLSTNCVIWGLEEITRDKKNEVTMLVPLIF